MRDPLVQWCERRTPSANADGAVYSIVDMFINIPTFVEDCFKFFGIAGWAAYQIHTAYQLASSRFLENKVPQESREIVPKY
ncbi:hypothetical protein, partial [uncultured Pontibacter sp.]|uniref:hypothetical protein n=1 Tax=uncultured Pontibacter sp. TaxID=453356 RepID=UPI0026043D9F